MYTTKFFVDAIGCDERCEATIKTKLNDYLHFRTHFRTLVLPFLYLFQIHRAKISEQFCI